ncbi:MAG: alpha/beta hydrolase [Gammaproteobacteria bacterium]
MSSADPGCVEVEPRQAATASIVWLHGLGADGHDFEPTVPELGLSTVRFVFPHAPVRKVTLNGGMPMRAWFDIVRLNFEGGWDETGVAEAVTRVDELLRREETRGVPRERQFLAGFSQGGAVALEYLLRRGGGLVGVVALSSFHPAGVRGASPVAPGAPPLFAAHGLYDPVVPLVLGERTQAAFAHAGYEVSWHRYPMAHQVSGAELADLAAWLRLRLGPTRA